jgi:hypothetical protein
MVGVKEEKGSDKYIEAVELVLRTGSTAPHGPVQPLLTSAVREPETVRGKTPKNLNF